MGSANQTAREFLLDLVALRALLRIQFSLEAFVFFMSPSAEGAGSIVRGRVFEGLSI